MFQYSNGQGDQCTSSSSIGVVGFPVLQISNEYLYLNTGDSAECSGTITAFSYCYYRLYSPPTSLREDGQSYRTNFGLYRPRMENGNTVYDLVSRVLTIEKSQNNVDDELDWE